MTFSWGGVGGGVNSIFRFSRMRVNICNSLYGKKEKMPQIYPSFTRIGSNNLLSRNSQNERAKVKKEDGEYRE